MHHAARDQIMSFTITLLKRLDHLSAWRVGAFIMAVALGG